MPKKVLWTPRTQLKRGPKKLGKVGPLGLTSELAYIYRRCGHGTAIRVRDLARVWRCTYRMPYNPFFLVWRLPRGWEGDGFENSDASERHVHPCSCAVRSAGSPAPWLLVCTLHRHPIARSRTRNMLALPMHGMHANICQCMASRDA